MQFSSLLLSDWTFITAGIGLVALIALLTWNIRLEVRLKRLLRGKRGADLEHVLRDLHKESATFRVFCERAEHVIENLHNRIAHSARGVATVRFDAFAGTGSSGKQSFATAIVTEQGDGVVISSMHARHSTRVFAKPLSQFASEHELTEEEHSAIDEARRRAVS